ncbi:MAG: CRISPR-associated protein Cas4 [Candidatus Accumulibacter sp.]|uniref:CRISPR-associated protein Cas4 n=1 Tax=Accumulibacter sp. TaxID=2053492 RepID=UPI001ACF1355|nr:CRISPR-associated protein Cas4 [Accumulibacter sp.]MBN8438534.1 CRISPR-associated protein Cas4 [Accumulibacter sp.]
MTDDLEPVNVSALNQYAYCPRRCALIYLENEFAENRHTASGNAEHARVDRVAHASNREGARVEYALPIWSERLGLIGKGDVVEFWPDGTIYPVEYKHGVKKQHDNDDLQLAAQALCLEEMFGRPILRGAIFHARSKRRREVMFTSQLRAATEQTVASIRQMPMAQTMPPPLINDTRCRECSLIDLCQPQALGNLKRLRREDLFDPNR